MQRSNVFFNKKIRVADWLFTTFEFSKETKHIVGISGSDGRVFPSMLETVAEMHKLAQKDKTGDLQKVNDERFKKLFENNDSVFTPEFKVQYATIMHYIQVYVSFPFPFEPIRAVNLESFCLLNKILKMEMLFGDDEHFEVNKGETAFLRHDYMSAHDFLLKRYSVSYGALIKRIEQYNVITSFSQLQRRLNALDEPSIEIFNSCLSQLQVALSVFNAECREFTIPDFTEGLDLDSPHTFHLNNLYFPSIVLEAKLKSSGFFCLMGKSLFTTIVEFQE